MYKPNWTRTVASLMSIPMCGSCLLRQPMKGTPGELANQSKVEASGSDSGTWSRGGARSWPARVPFNKQRSLQHYTYSYARTSITLFVQVQNDDTESISQLIQKVFCACSTKHVVRPSSSCILFCKIAQKRSSFISMRTFVCRVVLCGCCGWEMAPCC